MPDPILLLTFVVIIALLLWILRHRTVTRKSDSGVRVIGEQSKDRSWLWGSLSPREMEVARLVSQGKRNADIAHELSITTNTVESHLKHIYTKLNVHSRVDLARTVRELVE